MARFFVQLAWPKSASLPIYCNELDAPSKDEAVRITVEQARREGFANPSKTSARRIGVPA